MKTREIPQSSLAHVVRTRLPGDTEECRFHHDHLLCARILLLPERHFSFALYQPENNTPVSVISALAQVIWNHSGAAPEEELQANFARLDHAGAEQERPYWADLPDVLTTPVEVSGRLTWCGLACEGEVALLSLSHDTALARFALRFTRRHPRLFLAILRVVEAYSDAVSADKARPGPMTIKRRRPGRGALNPSTRVAGTPAGFRAA